MTLKFQPKIHSEVINMCTDGGTMENCHEFQEVVVLLNTANDFVKEFSKIRYKGGNEPYIQEISTRLGSYLKRAGFAKDSDGTLSVTNCDVVRKIVWYLVLNTEHEYNYTLDEDPNISHCLHVLPKLTPCLLLETLWHIHLDQFLYEMVSYTPSWFVITWFNDILESLRGMEPFLLLERVYHLLTAVLPQLKNLSTEKNLTWEMKEMYLEKISDFVAALLCHFNSPPGQLEKWSSQEKSKYYGFIMYYLLSVTQQGMLMYGDKDVAKMESTLIRFYKINVDIKVGIKKETDPEEFNNDDSFKEICNMFLNTLENISMLIDANMFIDWYELDFPDPRHLDDEYTLQNIISNLANELSTLQRDTIKIKHDVFQKLQSIQLPRKSTKEFAKDLNLGTLMEKLDNYKILLGQDALMLLEEFLSRGMIYNNEECLETLGNCKALLRPAQCELIIKTVAEEEDVEESCQEKLGQLLSDVIDSMTESDLLQFLSQHRQYLTTFYKNISFNCDLEDVLYDPSTNSLNVLRAIAKNPHQLLPMSIDIITNTQKFNAEIHKQIIGHYTKTLIGVLPHMVEPSSDNLTKTWNDVLDKPFPDSTGLVHFFTQLYSSPILTPSNFVKNLVIQNIATETPDRVNSTMNVTQVLLKALDVDADGLKQFLPMLLVTYGFYLDKLRGALESYGTSASSLLDLVTTVMHKLVKGFLPMATEEQKLFVQLQLKDTQPLTKYYLHKIDLPKGQESATLEHFLHPPGFTSMPKRLITATFCEYLTKCTRKEIILLTKNHNIRHYFTDAMLIIVMSLSESPQTFTLEFALKNYLNLFQVMVNEEEQGVPESVTLIKDVVKIFCVLPESQKEVVAYGIVAHLKKLVGSVLERDETMKDTVQEELLKTKMDIFSPEIIIAGK